MTRRRGTPSPSGGGTGSRSSSRSPQTTRKRSQRRRSNPGRPGAKQQSGGARAGHRFTKPVEAWAPTETLSRNGVVTADPLALLQAEAVKYKELWGGGGDGVELIQPSKARLERLTPEQIRNSSKAFKKHGAVAYDGFHMRHFSVLSDKALMVLAIILEVSEGLGLMPRQLRRILYFFVRMARGGLPPHSPLCLPLPLVGEMPAKPQGGTRTQAGQAVLGQRRRAVC